MEWEQIDSSVFKYPPKDKKSIKALQEYEEFKVLDLANLPAFVNYVILMYDFKSPLRSEYPSISSENNLNYSRKKMESAKLAGYQTIVGKDGKRKFDEATQDIILMNNTQTNEAIARYISLFGRPEYAALVAYEEMLILKIKRALNGEDEKTEKIHITIEFLYGKISELSDILFGGRETVEARQAFYAIAEKQDLNIFPEQIAQILKDGNLPIEMSPLYGKIPDKDIIEMQQWKSTFLGSQKPN